MLRDDWDLFLLERGQFISIRVSGQECGPSVERLARVFPALDLIGKNCLALELAHSGVPGETGFFRFDDDMAGVSIWDSDADSFYQQIIAAGVDGTVDAIYDLMADFDRVKAECEDPYFGMTPEQVAQAQTLGRLAGTDTAMARITEETVAALDRLIDILEATGVITTIQVIEIKALVTQSARDKIANRQSLRAAL